MGKAYKTGKQTFSARARKHGHDLFVSGYSTKQAAKEELDRQLLAIKKLGAPQHGGPQRTTLAQALQDFGLEHLPNLKGAAQEARRINKYLAACGLQLLEVLPNAPQGESSTAKPAELGVYKGLHASLRLRPRDAVASIPNGLGPYRKALIAKTSGSDTVRQRLSLGPLDLDGYLRLTPQGAATGKDLPALVEIVRSFVGFEYVWEVALLIDRTAAPQSRLGDGTQLGWSTWMAGEGACGGPVTGMVFEPESYCT